MSDDSKSVFAYVSFDYQGKEAELKVVFGNKSPGADWFKAPLIKDVDELKKLLHDCGIYYVVPPGDMRSLILAFMGLGRMRGRATAEAAARHAKTAAHKT